jgi:exodeoxyribonuclease VII small subunit
MSDKSDKKKKEDQSYAAASAELEQILQDIESGQIDLDVLAEKVERAAVLLAVCRQRLVATETKVKKITAEIGAAMDGAAEGTRREDAGDDDDGAAR